ncbi:MULTISPECIES: ATP-binding protein [Methylorubrum]|jgi:signal transduction histidine kinase|uniref:histidine kinase n=3 Tax=Methylorubrum TaxID=2282523 RepID=A0A177JCA4_9HYPH|nr:MULTISPECIES: ATP-binding protein [Methylorubrum]ACB79571.1 integral membrane sensor signal transduction histidine kinase [Methylorubrum populi BJ001]KAB7785792.1 Sensor histidine kinase [Methylorubrum populi]MBA8914764.1 signal transduction histidine kinase [Methylorubrum thiocyanatum]OAH38763.1 ATPase [Methylorubrum populi]PZP70403.1 MAG: ATP-binding protein [Methylorubrum populi]
MTDRLAWLPLRRRSIAVRLAVSSFLSSTAILVIAAFILTTLYRENTERAFDSRLLVFANNLATDLVSPSDPETRSFSLGDPRFDLPLSGWYWQVGRPDAKPRDLRTSRSLVGVPLKGPDQAGTATIGQIRQGYGKGQDDRTLRIVERDVDVGADGRYTVRVAGPADEIVNDVERFRFSLFMTFGLLGFSLAATALLQIRFGLAPLRKLRTALGTIRRGEADRIDGEYPRDIAPLAGEINLLIETNREILERARTQVGNLAHALKTPLSIIVNEAGSSDAPPELSEKIREQAAVMRDQVNYHLDRARAAALAGTLGTSTDVEPALAGLVRTFGKIYRDKDIAYEVHVPPGLRFRGEKQDFEEMIGNLVDNASKWATGRVSISAAPTNDHDYPHLLVAVEDDGPGLPEEDRAAVLKRGRRLDETKPGSGLGLSIVADLAALYRGRFRLEAAALGGLRAVIEVPGDAPAGVGQR